MKNVRVKRQSDTRRAASKQRLHANRRAFSSRRSSRNRITSQRREIGASTRHFSTAIQQSATRKEAEARYLAAVENLNTALRHMQKQRYAKAAEILQKLVNGPIQEVANRARIHLHQCERRLKPSVFAPQSAEDFYNLGVFELNARALALAVEHLTKAAKMKPGQDHIHYALASAYALQRDADSALRHLSRAVALRPENRFQVQLDRDFASLTDNPRFRQLVNRHSSKGRD